LKALLYKYKSVIRFVVLFLGTYLLLTVLYALYLKLSKESAYPPDYVTHLVAKQSSTLINGFGFDAKVIPHEAQPTMKLFVEGQYLAQIIEGCNAISIIILFIAFVVAFAERFRKTLFFIFAGVAIIYTVNVLRIAILAIALYRYPHYEETLHGVVFPSIIYGMVFLLWMLWIRIISKGKEETDG
jgi:exosortase family protein XrtF